MKKLIVLPIAIIVALIFFNTAAISANLPTDPNPTISVMVDNSQNEILRYASSIRTQNKSGYLSIRKKSSEYADGVEIYSTRDLGYRSIYACVDENVNQYATVSNITYIDKSSNDRLVRKIGAYHIQTSAVHTNLSDAQNELNYVKSKGIGCFIAYVNGNYVIRIGDYATPDDASVWINEFSTLLGYNNMSYSVETADGKTDYTKPKVSASIISANEVKTVDNFPNGIHILDGNGNVTQKTSSSSSLSVVGANPNTITLISNDDGIIVMEFESTTETLSVTSHDRALIYHRNIPTDGECYFGDLNFSIKNSKIKTLNFLKTQDYLKIVVPTENGYKYKEALKAQAVAARNFALSKLSSKRHGDAGAMVCDTTHCQAYKMYGDYYINDQGQLKPNIFSEVIPAVDETIGEVGLYKNNIVEIIYADSFGGKSLADADAWYSWDESKGTYVRPVPKPYYPSQYDEFDTEINAFSFTYSKRDLYDMAYNGGSNNSNLVQYPSQIAGMGISTIERIEVMRRSDSGIPVEIDLVNGNNRIQIKGAIHIQGFFKAKAGNDNAKCPNFYIDDTMYPDGNGNFVISGKGWGHNVGMSQTGAKNRAIAGQNYKQILNFYYSNNLSIFKIS